MGNIELRITLRDWVSVLVIGILFSSFLSIFGYYLLKLDVLHGGIFGLGLGFFITFFSLVFITTMNRYLLPNISKRWWNTIAAFFSFLSGFLGTITTHILLGFTPIKTIELFAIHPFQSAGVIGLLTYLMGSLIYRFVKTRNEKEHIDTLFVQSRVSSLETQLNPHFLFNALNSLAELIHQDPIKAEEAVLKISTFLRNTMGEKALIILGEELQNVRDYIDLENIRFNGAITLHIQTNEAVLKRLIPKFSIQLLCENAIKHGMKNSSEPFTITIHAEQSKMLCIRVSNSGRPITKTAFGIGLSNLQERLTHLCHGQLRIENIETPTYLIELKDCYEHIDR